MHERIAVALARRGEEKARAFGLGQAERVVRAERADFQRRDRVLEVIDRRGRRGEVEDEIHVVRQEDVVRDVVLDEAVVLVAREVLDVRALPGDEIVDPDDAMPFREQPVREMRAEKSGAAGDHRDGLRTGACEHGSAVVETPLTHGNAECPLTWRGHSGTARRILRGSVNAGRSTDAWPFRRPRAADAMTASGSASGAASLDECEQSKGGDDEEYFHAR